MIHDKFICFFCYAINYRSNHSGNNGSSGSLPSSGIGGNGVSSLNSDETNNSEYLNNNNNSADNGAGAEICDVPYEVANQKRHVSFVNYVNSNRINSSEVANRLLFKPVPKIQPISLVLLVQRIESMFSAHQITMPFDFGVQFVFRIH